jgi:hypothetical protein
MADVLAADADAASAARAQGGFCQRGAIRQVLDSRRTWMHRSGVKPDVVKRRLWANQL